MHKVTMHDDQQAIRMLFADWHAATANGDVAGVLKLMAEDVVFLVAGQPPMKGRAAFAEAFQRVLPHQHVTPSGVIEELEIVGDFAYCRSYLTVRMTPTQGGETKELSGYTLTILRKQLDGRWVLARDANMLTSKPAPAK